MVMILNTIKLPTIYKSAINKSALCIKDKLPNSNLMFRYQIDYTPNALYGEEADIISLPNKHPLETFERVILNKNTK